MEIRTNKVFLMIIHVIISLFLNVLLDYKSKPRRDIYHQIITTNEIRLQENLRKLGDIEV
jgi:hypothetical protein